MANTPNNNKGTKEASQQNRPNQGQQKQQPGKTQDWNSTHKNGSNPTKR
ncbi:MULTISPECIES: hypothetical protein [Legionella]|nr:MULTISPECIES: hypothetical protein [Legionella]MCP0914758.1 hypothetical protein [Legionella sp. 27cVA30]